MFTGGFFNLLIYVVDLGGPHGDLALIRHQLISLAIVANNVFHLWLTTFFNNNVIIPLNTLNYLPLGVRDILHLIQNNASAIYVHERLPSGHE